MKQDKLIIAIFSLLIVILGSITVGFFIGRSTINTKTDIKYVKGETVRDWFPILTPFKVSIPSDPIYKYKENTAVVDTAAIINDWIIKRDYKQTLFDNNNGKLDIDFSVQYNKPFNLGYSFTPIQKQTTIYKVKTWQPFISASYSTLNYVSFGGGIFYHNLGFELRYVTDFNQTTPIKQRVQTTKH